MLTRLQRLYQEAEEAGEAFNATDVELARLRAEARRLTSGLDRARTALALSRDDAGRLAREQYQGRSGLSGYARFLLARDPRSALDEGHLMKRAARGRAEILARLTGGERRASALADAARRALQRQQVLAARQKKQRDTVRARLAEVEKLLASLTPAQLAALAALEKSATDKAQRELLTSGALGNVPGASTEPGPAGAVRQDESEGSEGSEGSVGPDGPMPLGSSGPIGPAGAAGPAGVAGPAWRASSPGSHGTARTAAPSRSVDPTGSSDLTGSYRPTGSNDPRRSVRPTGSPDLTGSRRPTEPNGPSRPFGPTGAPDLTRSYHPTGPDHPSQPVRPTGPPDPTGPYRPTEPNGPSRPFGPTPARPEAPGRRTGSAPSAQGGHALAYAVAQIGKPYQWGAEGPASFDCSGLTSEAWGRAGVVVPRTSQQQWRDLPHVPLDRLRPGDLVVYFPKATHVAIYLGDGMVIQAPRPGTRVKVSPIAANPLLGAVRPDPGAVPMTSYEPPPLPPDAGPSSSDLGNDNGTPATPRA
ncbi:C40 family peptidase [Streptomyces sp. SID3212]|uniref:C40 family peptidase n=1 Tax=Streptomyces sp. SID3212 TaxID=2690259 RepID=UPI001F17028B|nr:C40 family peptidase [Streptomyces sp. SID3212]